MPKTSKRLKVKTSIAQAVNYLKEHFDVQQAILFGSQASGSADINSDIDLAIISPDFKGKTYEEILKVFCGLALKFGSKVELRPYIPEDLKSARPTNFLGFILKNGKTVYKNGKLLI